MEFVAGALGFTQAFLQIGEAGRQKTVDKAQTELSYLDNLEKIRRRKFEQEQTQGTALAFSEASGVRHTGGSTAQGFLDTMAGEFKKELDWMQKFADEARRLGHKRASVAHRTNVAGAITGGIQTGAAIYSI